MTCHRPWKLGLKAVWGIFFCYEAKIILSRYLSYMLLYNRSDMADVQFESVS